MRKWNETPSGELGDDGYSATPSVPPSLAYYSADQLMNSGIHTWFLTTLLFSSITVYYRPLSVKCANWDGRAEKSLDFFPNFPRMRRGLRMGSGEDDQITFRALLEECFACDWSLHPRNLFCHPTRIKKPHYGRRRRRSLYSQPADEWIDQMLWASTDPSDDLGAVRCSSVSTTDRRRDVDSADDDALWSLVHNNIREWHAMLV